MSEICTSIQSSTFNLQALPKTIAIHFILLSLSLTLLSVLIDYQVYLVFFFCCEFYFLLSFAFLCYASLSCYCTFLRSIGNYVLYSKISFFHHFFLVFIFCFNSFLFSFIHVCVFFFSLAYLSLSRMSLLTFAL